MLNARVSHPQQAGRSAASLTLDAPLRGPRVLPLELPRFLAFCAWLALWGGLDVVRRALHPRGPRGRFGQVETRNRLPRGAARRVFLEVVGLVPGAFAVEVRGDFLTVHLLDASPGLRATCLAQVRELEARVARVFGLPPPPRGLP